MKITEPIHTTSKGWDRLYREYRDSATLVLGIIDHKITSTIRWDILQLDPRVGLSRFPEKQAIELKTLWTDYLRGVYELKPSRPLRQSLRWASFGLYGSIPVLKTDVDEVAGRIKMILSGLDGNIDTNG